MIFERLVSSRRGTPQTNNPLSAISSLQKEMNRMFNNIWSTSRLSPPRTAHREEVTGFFCPDVEMAETDGHIEISAELPGVDEKDLDIVLSPDGNTLSIKGEKNGVSERMENGYYCAERVYGAFRRNMRLPAPVSPEKVVTKFQNGVLEIRLKKIDDAEIGATHIEVRSS